jgi:predicted lipoprotein with Yx(FWY)xxD motif
MDAPLPSAEDRKPDRNEWPAKHVLNGPCAENWPPLMAGADAKPTGDWTVVKRDDGKMMWAYKGKPLYTFKRDTAPGETNGDGFLNGAWHMAKP